MPPFEQYRSPGRSKAEAHRSLIEEMREANWPLKAIREHLAAEHGVSITVDALWKFCRRRNIPKGDAGPGPVKPAAAHPPADLSSSAGSPPARQTVQPSAVPPESVEAPPPVRRKNVGSDGLTVEERIAKARKERAEQDAKYDLGLSYKGGPLTLKTNPPSNP